MTLKNPIAMSAMICGFSIFWADDGLDTGPLLLQRQTELDAKETVESVYNRFLFPEGIKAMAEAVELIKKGEAPRIAQSEEGASYEPKLNKESSMVKINELSGEQLHIFTHVKDSMYIAIEESFGPIIIISSFPNGDIDGVLRRANATEFGLASGVFTKDISKALYVTEKINAGTCFVNCYNKTDVAAPFGGFKQSGFGKDLGQEALNEYLKTKTITIEY